MSIRKVSNILFIICFQCSFYNLYNFNIEYFIYKFFNENFRLHLIRWFVRPEKICHEAVIKDISR